MATKTAILSVKIVSDAKDFSSKMDSSAGKMDKFNTAAKKLAVPATAVLAGLGAIAVGAGKMASESEQNFGAVDAVFKDHAKSVKDMAKDSASTLGLSASDYAKYSALLGSQLKNAGTPMDQLAGQTDKLIGYGADFAAQFGGTVPDAVEALSSALKGEMDPIEKYGISLNQAKIDAEASALGFEKVGGAWESSAKQAAIMSLVSKQGADAMGAFGREAGTAAGQQAIATAKWQDASAALGTVLLPIMTQAATILADVAKWVMQNQTVVTALAIVIGVLAVAILAVNAAMWLMAANPMVLAITAIIVVVLALVAGIVYLATQTQFFQTVWAAVTNFAKSAWQAFTSFVSTAWGAVVAYFQTVAYGMQVIWQAIVTAIRVAWDAAVAWIRNAVANVAQFFASAANSIRNGWNAAINFVRNIIGNVASYIASAVNRIRAGWNSAFAAIRSAVANAISNIMSTMNRVSQTASQVVNNARNVFSSGFNAVRGVVSNVIGAIGQTLHRIVSTVVTVINSARNIFSSGFSAMSSFASSMISNVVGGFNNIVNAVSNAIGWVRSLFSMGGMPGWLSKVLGMGGTGFEFTGAFAPVSDGFGMGATGGLSYGSVLSGSRTAPVVNNYSITVNGAVDPQSVARQLKSILNSDAQRTGKIEVGRSIW